MSEDELAKTIKAIADHMIDVQMKCVANGDGPGSQYLAIAGGIMHALVCCGVVRLEVGGEQAKQ